MRAWAQLTSPGLGLEHNSKECTGFKVRRGQIGKARWHHFLNQFLPGFLLSNGSDSLPPTSKAPDPHYHVTAVLSTPAHSPFTPSSFPSQDLCNCSSLCLEHSCSHVCITAPLYHSRLSFNGTSSEKSCFLLYKLSPFHICA